MIQSFEMDFGDNTLNSVGFGLLRETFIGLLMFNGYPCIHLSIACGNFLWCGCLLTIDALVM